jgi:Carboxypeptidase regulatory-like domain
MIRRLLGCAVTSTLVTLLCACGTPSTPSTGHSGIAGVVVAGPQCPAEVIGHPCPPKPISATVTVTGPSGEVTTFTSDADGRFRIDLPPGTYELTTQGGNHPQLLQPVKVTVAAGTYTRVRLLLDTGIR